MSADEESDTVTPDELRELADAMGWHTQQDIADALGITQPRVSQILSGAYPIKLGPLLNLIRQLQAQHLRKKPKRG